MHRWLYKLNLQVGLALFGGVARIWSEGGTNQGVETEMPKASIG